MRAPSKRSTETHHRDQKETANVLIQNYECKTAETYCS